VRNYTTYVQVTATYCCPDSQGRNEVRWRPGQEARSATPCSKLRSFRSKCIEESTCDIVGTFRRSPQTFGAPAVIWRPHSDSAPGELCSPYPPRYAPVDNIQVLAHDRNFASATF